jgi:hypothetical protein
MTVRGQPAMDRGEGGYKVDRGEEALRRLDNDVRHVTTPLVTGPVG